MHMKEALYRAFFVSIHYSYHKNKPYIGLILFTQQFTV